MQERYRKEVVPALMKRFGRTNPMAVPKVAKVIVNIGWARRAKTSSCWTWRWSSSGRLPDRNRWLRREEVDRELQDSPAHADCCCVTLRGTDVRIPGPPLQRRVARVARFPGLRQTRLDGRGNYTMGLRDQLVSEIDYTARRQDQGMNITLTDDG